MRYLALIPLLIALASCEQEPLVTKSYSEASYKMTITLNWQNPQFVVPAGAHVTTLIGMIHAKDVSLWKPGTLASKGLENVAEVGYTPTMNLELDSIIARNKAISKFSIAPPTVTGTVMMDLDLNTNFPCISFASMIAPSPDWFMGIHDVNLYQNDRWTNDITLNIMLYDAGTEDGDVFGYNNPATIPQQVIALLTPLNASVLANGNPAIAAIGTARFVKK